MEAVISSVITGVLALVGVIITDRRSSDKVLRGLERSFAVSQEKVDALTREVREHNNFARRLPVVEEQLRDMERRMRDLESRQQYRLGQYKSIWKEGEEYEKRT